MTTSLRRRVGAGSMALGLSAGRKRGEGYGGDTVGVGDGAMGEGGMGWPGDMGQRFSWVTQGRCGATRRHPNGAGAGDRRGTDVPLVPLRRRMGSDHLVSALGPWQPITRNFTLRGGHGGDTGAGDEHASFEGPIPAGLTCRAPGRAGARCRGPGQPGPRTPCHPRLAGALSSVPSRRTQPPPSPASCRSGRWAAPRTAARQPGTGGS